MTSVRGRGRPTQRSQASKAPTGPSSSNADHEDTLRSNEPGPSKALTGSKAPAEPETSARPEAPPGPPQAPPLPVPQDLDAHRYSQQDLDIIIQTFFHTSKRGSEDKLKAKTSDNYRNKSHIECYNFCQQCEDHFVTCEATGLNRIPFAAFFYGIESSSAGSNTSGS